MKTRNFNYDASRFIDVWIKDIVLNINRHIKEVVNNTLTLKNWQVNNLKIVFSIVNFSDNLFYIKINVYMFWDAWACIKKLF